MYSSVPNGTPGTSTMWRSDDGTFAYPDGHAVTGSISRDTITWTVPAADVGNPQAGAALYDVQAAAAARIPRR